MDVEPVDVGAVDPAPAHPAPLCRHGFDLRRLVARSELDLLVPLAQAVAATGGAVGWLEVPSAQEVRDTFDRLLSGGAHLLVVLSGADVVGCGAWVRDPAVVKQGVATLSKVMTHPHARGRGVGDAIVSALVADAATAGVELLVLDARGNNHAALRLYARHGFVVTGRRPDALSVGVERFDSVLMHRDLRTGLEPLVRHGSRHVGPGRT